MKFGQVEDISSVDFSLPPDHPVTATVINSERLKKPEVFAGLPQWGEDGFVGRIYPAGAKPKDYSQLYSRLFNSIEFNASGYRIPTLESVKGWVKAVPEGFLFCPKVPQPIGQVKPLGSNRSALLAFYDVLHALGEHMGAVFLQLPPTFSPERFEDLVNFLQGWDHLFPLQVELRHPDWFSNTETLNSQLKVMRSLKVGTVITDTPGRRDALHMGLTTPTAFIRFVGNDLDPTDFTRIEAWVERIRVWMDKGLEKIYFFSHTETKALAPVLSNYFLATTNKRCGSDLKLAPILTPFNSKGEIV